MTHAPLDRRSLLKASAATAAGALIVSRLSAQGAGTTKKLDPIRVGLVGCGGRGTGAAMNALEADAGVVITALGDCLADRLEISHKHLVESHPERVKVDADKRFVGFDAIDRVLATDIDVVLLATPPHWRPAQIEAAVKAGKHVFAEKPMAVDAPGVRAIIESCKRAEQKKLSVVSGFCWRSSKPERATYQKIHEGAIGAVRTVYATYNSSPLTPVARKPEWSEMEYQIRNWYHYLWLGGDHLVEQACHSVDKINWAMNNEAPLRCWAVGGRAQRLDTEPGNIFDHFSVTYEYSGDRRGYLMARQWDNCPSDNSDWVYGEKGIARINGWGPEHWIRGENNWRYDAPAESAGDMYVHEHEEFFAGIRSGKHRNDSAWMNQSTLMAIMGRMAAYTGQAVTWEQALASVERLGPDVYAMGDVTTSAVPRPGHTKFS
ncbi:MAG: Gfo/Idh/MocA family oxidoreductase [Planctomycetes bacterium]|nr:Gfo/Idh/MocA family oxidoreductase [Planctomycetota bacterium]